jgi:ubiquinone/menaquinone biosynthesis C-methylase UbiE
MDSYVHGYSNKEARRLADQANTLAEILLSNIKFPKKSRILEPGCGIGAQTLHLAENNPETQFLSFDLSRKSISRAKVQQVRKNLSNVHLEVASIYDLPYADNSFDGTFACFLLEHLPDPVLALQNLRKVLKPGSPIIAVEGDHGSYFCHPRSQAANYVVQCLIAIQAHKCGNALIGRSLYPLLDSAGFKKICVVPKIVYVDSSKPDLVEGFTRKTFIAMAEGVKEDALALELIDKKTWDQGIRDLHRTTHKDGTFCYTFFQASAVK